MKKITAYIIGGFAGAVLISGLVLLLAPTSGKELRARIRMKYMEMESEFKQASQERREELEAQLASLRKGLPSGGINQTNLPVLMAMNDGQGVGANRNR